MERLVDDAAALAASKGLLCQDERDSKTFRLQRFTLLPVPLRRREYERTIRLSAALNKLTMSIAADRDFLCRALRRTAAADRPFTVRLVALLHHADGPPHGAEATGSRIHFAVNRYDFFVDASTDPLAPPERRGLRLVKLNCMAAGGVIAVPILSEVHAALAQHPAAAAAGCDVGAPGLAENDCDRRLTSSIVFAHRLFEERYSVRDARTVMVVIPPYQMRTDHALVQWHVIREGVEMVRMTPADIQNFGVLTEKGHVQVRDFGGETFTISVAYIRTGYMPEDYPTEREWDGRRLLEQSTAVSFPSVAMQLTGMKKMQEVLGQEGVLERFLSREEAEMVQETLVGQWDASDERAAARAMKNPGSYILKPQREGGGNNLSHADMRRVLEKLPREKRATFTLMERIYPAATPNIMVEAGGWKRIDVQSELGLYASAVAVNGRIVFSESVGMAVRIKASDTDEGGVICGCGAYGSFVLME